MVSASPSLHIGSQGQRKLENIAAEAKLRSGRQKYFWKISTTFFAFKTQILYLQHMLWGGGGGGESKLGSIWETLKKH